MKRTKLSIIAAIFLTSTLMTACQKETADQSSHGPDPSAEREYTVMLYGCGGGNLDRYLIENLKQGFSVGCDDSVAMSCLIKFSKGYHNPYKPEGAIRFVIPPEPSDFELKTIEKETIGTVSYPLFDPESLADFIDWNRKYLPARNYILVLWNHGGGWNPRDDRTRALIFDDNVDSRPLTHPGLIEALEKSDVHLKAIVMDACQMTLLETCTDYARYADYLVGAVEMSPNIGLRYDWLLQALKKSDFEAAMRDFSDTLCHYWETNCPLDPNRDDDEEMTDFGYVNLNMMDRVNEAFRKVVDGFSDSFTDSCLEAVRNTRCFPHGYFADAATLVSNMTSDSIMLNEFCQAIDSCSYRYVIHPDYEQQPWRNVSIGICLPPGSLYRSEYRGVYDSLTFARRTGWPRILEKL